MPCRKLLPCLVLVIIAAIVLTEEVWNMFIYVAKLMS